MKYEFHPKFLVFMHVNMKQTKKQNWHVKETKANEVIFKEKVFHKEEPLERKKCVCIESFGKRWISESSIISKWSWRKLYFEFNSTLERFGFLIKGQQQALAREFFVIVKCIPWNEEYNLFEAMGVVGKAPKIVDIFYDSQ